MCVLSIAMFCSAPLQTLWSERWELLNLPSCTSLWLSSAAGAGMVVLQATVIPSTVPHTIATLDRS